MNKKYLRKYLFVYKTTCLINGKIYVGKHKTHNLNDGYIGSGVIFNRAIKKYGRGNFERIIIDSNITTLERLNEREIFWVKELDATNPEIGYNIGRGGGGSNIEHHTEEHRKNNSNSHKGLKYPPPSEEVKKQRKETRKWYIHSEKTKQDISKKLIGHIQLETTEEKRKETRKNRPIETCSYCGYQSNAINMKTYHFDNCKHNPSYIPREKKPDTRELKICEWCGYQGKNSGVLNLFHGDNCKMNPNRIIKEKKPDTRKILTCEYCGLQTKSASNIKQFHGDNCKLNPNKIITEEMLEKKRKEKQQKTDDKECLVKM